MRSAVRLSVVVACIVASSSGAAIGQTPNRQPPPPRHGSFPNVSPDGKHVLFARDSGGQPLAYIMDADGSNQMQLPVNAGGAAWFPDSKHLFVGMRGQTRASPVRLVTMNVDGTDTHEVSLGGMSNVAGGRLMPDGKTIMLATAVRDSGGHIVSAYQYYFMDLDGSHVRPFSLPAVSGRILGAPVPSHDGRRVAFAVADTTDPTTPFRSTTLYVMNVDGSGQRAIATLPDGLEQLAWSYDDRKIALQHDGHEPRNRALLPADYVPDAHIVVIDVATGAVQELAHPDRRYLDETPSWSPDGHIYIQSDRDGRMEIYRMNADGSNPQRITK